MINLIRNTLYREYRFNTKYEQFYTLLPIDNNIVTIHLTFTQMYTVNLVILFQSNGFSYSH